MIQSRPDPLHAFTGSGCGYARLGEQQVPDEQLKLQMLHDCLDSINSGVPPGIAVLLTGDGAGFMKGTRFQPVLAKMVNFGGEVEVMSWELSCHRAMKQWLLQNGIFVPLDTFYLSITFSIPRISQEIDMRKRPGVARGT